MNSSRRQFLSLASSLPLIGMPWANAASLSSGSNLLVLIYLKGGNDSYNTVVPYTSERYARFRPTIAIKRDQVIRINDSHGFHPSLASMLPLWEANELALLQGIGQQEITNQHYRDLEMQFTGASPDQYLNDGWVTRALASAKSTGTLDALAPSKAGSALDALAFGDLDIRMSDPMGPFRGDRLRVINMQHPSEWLSRHQVQGTQHLASAPGKEAAKSFAQRDPVALKTAFPADEFGDALKATVELAAAGLAPPVVHITINASNGDHHDAFDTHWNQLKFHGAALSRLANGLAALRNGMKEIGQWDRTLVATYDEFGRSPKENGDKGTHHGWSSVHFVTGGRVKGGLYGEPMPVVDVFAIDGPAPVIDYRELYTTVIQDWWGLPSRGVFDRAFKPLPLLRT